MDDQWLFAALLLGAALVFWGVLILRALNRQQDMWRQDLHSQDEQAVQNLRVLEQRLQEQQGREQALLQGLLFNQEQGMSAKLDALTQRLDMAQLAQDERLRHVQLTVNERLQANDGRVEKMRETLYLTLSDMQKDNAQKLEEMRKTVDSRLEETLNRRLGESFQLVSERLEQVYQGLGEMRTLAGGVGELKKVLTNVKTRGIWGELQLGALIEEVLPRDCYVENVNIKPETQERVEFAILLPGQGEDKVLLPVDAKFPVESYMRLLEAEEKAEKPLIEQAKGELTQALLREAGRIQQKYIAPPQTLDFAILYLPIEGLYAAALQLPGLVDKIRKEKHIVLAGPNTFHALLNSLLMGFRTLQVQKRSGEVWQLLGGIRTEFAVFLELLEKTQQRLRQASESIDTASRKSRTIERKLRQVETTGRVEGEAAPPDLED